MLELMDEKPRVGIERLGSGDIFKFAWRVLGGPWLSGWVLGWLSRNRQEAGMRARKEEGGRDEDKTPHEPRT